MRAFIIRPFGKKRGIDFDEVERLLVGPALDGLGVVGRSSAAAVAGGDVRGDLFRMMLTSDLVVADVTLRDANVFYELGVCHALRDKRTLLISAAGDEHPFDLTVTRYVTYNAEDPAASVEKLWGAVYQMIGSETADSPVYAVFPRLRPHPLQDFVAVPPDFTAAVGRATHGRLTGDLLLLADEAGDFAWGGEGMRAVGQALLNLKSYEGARVVWEELRERDLFDLEAQTALATVYQRLGNLTLSDESIERALDSEGTGPETRSELLRLLGQNAKTRWRWDWTQAPDERKRERALQSPWLERSLEAYSRAYTVDLNNFYAGLNTLTMATIMTQLADAMPEV